MNTATHRDKTFREQPGLFDAPVVVPAQAAAPVVATTDQGKAARDETYREVKGDHSSDRMKWLCRVVAKGRRGATLDELSSEYNVPCNTFSGRFTELAGLGLVVRTGERRATRSGSSASVIVAVDFMRSESSSSKTGHSVIANKDFLPDQLTQTSIPVDATQRAICADRTYVVSRRGSAGRRMRVFESDGELFCQEVSVGGVAVQGSRPQRIDEMDSAASWVMV